MGTSPRKRKRLFLCLFGKKIQKQQQKIKGNRLARRSLGWKQGTKSRIAWENQEQGGGELFTKRYIFWIFLNNPQVISKIAEWEGIA
jgi:hypothetical protein